VAREVIAAAGAMDAAISCPCAIAIPEAAVIPACPIITDFNHSTPIWTKELITLFRTVDPSELMASLTDILPVSMPVRALEAFPANESNAAAATSYPAFCCLHISHCAAMRCCVLSVSGIHQLKSALSNLPLLRFELLD
jgi:hypothetical protein